METVANVAHREPWNKGKIVGQKAPFKLRDIWALRVRFQMENRVRELAVLHRTRPRRAESGQGAGPSGARAGPADADVSLR